MRPGPDATWTRNMKQNKLLNRITKKINLNPFRGPQLSAAMLAVAIATATAAHGQTFSVLYKFGAHVGDPTSPQYTGLLAQGRDGNLYSTSPNGGTLCSFCGAAFKITPSGTLTNVYNFNYPSGAPTAPFSGLTLGTDGDFYGTASQYGTFNLGAVFKITASGTLTTLYNFGTCKSPCVDGTYPKAPPVEGRDGNFYGTTPYSDDGTNSGVVYKVTPTGAYTILHRFLYTAAGYNPQAPLILGSDGNFYGTTTLGGKTVSSTCVYGAYYTCGTVFRMTPSGSVTFLHEFDKTDGAGPLAPVVQGTDGNFYGTTSVGGDANGDGVIFKLTPSGQYTVLHTFNGTTDGKQPSAGLVEATDGNFYGATTIGGSKNYGTIYKITAAGAFSVVYNFDNTTGSTPQVTLFQHTNGDLYGDAYGGGIGYGTVYTLDTELQPFVTLLPNWGTVGASIGILGQGFTSATAVSFDGASAKFTVDSDTYLTAVVPSAAITGNVMVTTGAGPMKSNRIFIVLPSVSSFSPTSGDAGDSVVITGGGFTNASQVTFDGVQATTFTVNSSSKITATVPTGVKTGKIAVTTPEGTATSSGTFTVVP
jgi:uncharacterized repeat protein (TIGR03803 family)